MLAAEPQVHPKLINKWKRRLLNDGNRVFANIFIERLWRTVKYEDIYLNV